jgi:hypothetical protein
MVTIGQFSAAICIALMASLLPACQKPNPTPAKATVGRQTTRLQFMVGSIWGHGYSVDVSPDEYVVVEHDNCPEAKDPHSFDHPAPGLCIVRITKEQSDRFEAAMARFKRNAVPLESYSVTDFSRRPDGKPCRDRTTDMANISLIWTRTDGTDIAAFDTGCDREEFDSFYKSVLAVTDPLPIQQIIGNH